MLFLVFEEQDTHWRRTNIIIGRPLGNYVNHPGGSTTPQNAPNPAPFDKVTIAVVTWALKIPLNMLCAPTIHMAP